MANKEVVIIRSGTWTNDNLDSISDVLDETIRELVPENARIINIETKEKYGLTRFWIYYTPNQ